MSIFVIGVLALSMTLQTVPNWIAGGQIVRSQAPKVPKGFSYPEARETVKVNQSNSIRVLAGRVADSNNAPIEKVLVERLSHGWGKRFGAIFTDLNGSFYFPGRFEKTQYLRLSKPGFDTLLIRVRVNGRSKRKLTLSLNPST